MPSDVDAICEDGLLKLKWPVNLPERSEVHVTIEARKPARTALGRRLLELRSQIAESGAPALGWNEIEEEVALRRGGWREGR
jgi:predicted DNA-binding antitoxin AbrB/MazE fold protein